MTLCSIKTNINFIILYRYGGWSFGLPLTNDLRFDVTAVPANRTLAKVNYKVSVRCHRNENVNLICSSVSMR